MGGAALIARNPRRDLVLLGGGHTHALALRRLAMGAPPGLRITLVSESGYSPYSGMLPGLIAGHYRFEDAHIDLRRLCARLGIRFIAARVRGVDAEARRVALAGRPPLEYDWLSINVGAAPNLAQVPGAAEYATPVKPVAGFYARWLELEKEIAPGIADGAADGCRIAIVGGGAGSVELALAIRHRLQGQYRGAAEIHAAQSIPHAEAAPAHRGGQRVSATGTTTAHNNGAAAQPTIAPAHDNGPRIAQPEVLLVCGEGLLETYNQGARRTVRRHLARAGVELREHRRVTAVRRGRLITTQGEAMIFDHLLWCTPAAAADWFRASRLPCDADGFLRARDTLQLDGIDNIFAAGDAATQINHPRPRAGVFAVRQAPALARNLLAAASGAPLKVHRPQRRFLSLLSLGERNAVADRGIFHASGPWVWRWKDFIDRRFMAKFDRASPAMPMGDFTLHNRTFFFTGFRALAVAVARSLFASLSRSLAIPSKTPSAAQSANFRAAAMRGLFTGLNRAFAARRKISGKPSSADGSAMRETSAVSDNLLDANHNAPGPTSAAESPMRCGGCGAKLPQHLLRGVLAELAREYPDTVDPRDFADDGAVLNILPGKQHVQSTDTLRALIDDPWLMGRLSALHALSDLYAMGATPHSCLAHAALPYGGETAQARDLLLLLSGAAMEMQRAGCRLLGGHSMEGPELSLGFTVNGSLDANAALPKTIPAEFSADTAAVSASPPTLSANPAAPADRPARLSTDTAALILTRPLGTGVIFAAHGYGEASADIVEQALTHMLQSNAPAADLAREHAVLAATDITGFGLLGHLIEMLRGAPPMQAALRLDAIPLLPGTEALFKAGFTSTLHPANRASAALYITPAPAVSPTTPRCQALYDPQTCGGLLLAATPENAPALVQALREAGCPAAAIIGEARASDSGKTAIQISP